MDNNISIQDEPHLEADEKIHIFKPFPFIFIALISLFFYIFSPKIFEIQESNIEFEKPNMPVEMKMTSEVSIISKDTYFITFQARFLKKNNFIDDKITIDFKYDAQFFNEYNKLIYEAKSISQMRTIRLHKFLNSTHPLILFETYNEDYDKILLSYKFSKKFLYFSHASVKWTFYSLTAIKYERYLKIFFLICFTYLFIFYVFKLFTQYKSWKLEQSSTFLLLLLSIFFTNPSILITLNPDFYRLIGIISTSTFIVLFRALILGFISSVWFGQQTLLVSILSSIFYIFMWYIQIQIGLQKGCIENSSSIIGCLTKFETILQLFYSHLPISSYKFDESSLLQPYFLMKIINNTYYFILILSSIIGFFHKDKKLRNRWINEIFVAIISQIANILFTNRMDTSELTNFSLGPTTIFYGMYLYSCFLLANFHLYA